MKRRTRWSNFRWKLCCKKGITWLGVVLHNRMKLNQHEQITNEKSLIYWIKSKSICSTKSGLSTSMQLIKYKTVPRPQVVYSACAWSRKNVEALEISTNNLTRPKFCNSHAKLIKAFEVILALLPINLCGGTLEVKCTFQSSRMNDFVTLLWIFQGWSLTVVVYWSYWRSNYKVHKVSKKKLKKQTQADLTPSPPSPPPPPPPHTIMDMRKKAAWCFNSRASEF